MSNYGQINYKQKVGSSNLGIDEAGCFLVLQSHLQDSS